jgi:hypothetical protein
MGLMLEGALSMALNTFGRSPVAPSIHRKRGFRDIYHSSDAAGFTDLELANSATSSKVAFADFIP